MSKPSTVISIAAPTAAADSSVVHDLARRLCAYRPPRKLRDRIKATCVPWDNQKPGDWLLVVCTPETPQDKTVLDAVESFLHAGLRGRVLLALSQGEPAESFPRLLRFEKDESGQEVEREPLAADLRGKSRQAVRKKLRAESLRLLAPVYGVGYDDLRQRQKERALRTALGSSIALLLFAVGFMYFAFDRAAVIKQQNAELDANYEQILISERKALEDRDLSLDARAQTLAVQSREQLSRGDTQMALLLALESLPAEGEERPAGEGAQAALYEALKAYCAKGYVSVTAWTPYSGQPEAFSDALDALETMQRDLSVQSLPDFVYVDGASYKKEFFHPDAKAAVYSGSSLNGPGAPHSLIHSLDDTVPDRPLTFPDGSPAGVFEAALTAEGILFAHYGKGICRWDLYTGACKGPLDLGQEIKGASSIRTTASGKWIYIGESYGRAWLADAVSGKPVSLFDDELFVPRSRDSADLDVLDDGVSPLLAFSNDQRAAVYDLLSGNMVCELAYDGGFISKPKLSADGRLVAARCGNSVRIYDVRSGSVLYRFPANSDTSVTFSGAYDPLVRHCGGEALLFEKSDEDQAICTFLLVYRGAEIGIPEAPDDKIGFARKLLGGRTLTRMERDRFYIH